MEEQTLDFSDYIGAFKRRRLSIFVIATMIFIIGALAAVLWPPTYKSSATILIKEQDIPSDLVRSTVTTFADQRIQAINQKVMARANLTEIIETYHLYEEERKYLTMEEVILRMRDSIGLDIIQADVVDPQSGRPMAATIAFQLSFSGEYPDQVQKVANELMSLYLKENLKERSEQSSETLAFLSAESNRLKQSIEDIESRIATFKEKHPNSLPELSSLNMTIMDRTEREISEADNRIRSLEERKIYLESQLSQLKPYGADISIDPATRLQALRTSYFGLLARYSEDHPDVIRARREIEALEVETGGENTSAEQLRQIDALRGELAVLTKKYSAEHPDVIKVRRQIEALEKSSPEPGKESGLASSAEDNPDNPAYIQLQSQLETADSEIRSLGTKKDQLRKKLAKYEQRLIETPQVEREYQTLKRDLRNTTAEYQEIHAKQMSAEIAHQLEKDSRGERFVIIEPPILPEEPVSPNRPAILFLSLVLALGAGIGYAAVAESLDDAVRGSKSLSFAIGAVPLAVIPYLENDREAGKRKRKRLTKVAAAVATIIIAIALLNIWKPLDVLWYKALRKADVVINT